MPRVRPHPDKDGFLIIGDKEYATVAKRLEAFRKDHPIASGWSIQTELLECDDYIHWKCEIIHPEGHTVANGNKRIRNGQHKLEACQTGAVGRALGFAGYACGEVASAEDMLEFYQEDEKLTAASFKPAAAPNYLDAVWDEHTTAEAEAFFARTEGLHMTVKEHEMLTASLGKPAPWHMNAATRMRYADWLHSDAGKKRREALK